MKQIELWRFRYFDTARKRYSTTSTFSQKKMPRFSFQTGQRKSRGHSRSGAWPKLKLSTRRRLQILGSVTHRGPL